MPESRVCPCCGHPMRPLTTSEQAAFAITLIESCGLDLAALRRPDRRRFLVEIRREVALYLKACGWGYSQIGGFLARDHSSVLNLLTQEPASAAEPVSALKPL